MIENSVVTRFSRFDRIDRLFNFQGNLIDTDDSFSQSDVTWTQTETQRCVAETRMSRSGTGETVRTTTTSQCSPSTPPGPDALFLVMDTVAGTSRLTKEQPIGTLFEISDSTHAGNGMVTTTVRFPDIPEGGVVREVRISPHPAAVNPVAYTRPPDWQFPGSTIDERTPEFVGHISNCPNWVASRTVTWTYPGTVVDAAGKFSFSFPVMTTCILQGTTISIGFLPSTKNIRENDLQQGVLQGFFRFEADVEVQDAMLALSADLEDLHPTNRRDSDPNVFGQSSTAILARLLEAPEGTYTINFDVRSFDSGVSGHDHASSPPKSFWGKLDGTAGSGSTAPAASCEITVNASGEGTCEVEYQADEVAGRISIGATVDVNGQMLDEELPRPIDVFIPGLFSLPASPTYVLRGTTPQHQVNHFARIDTLLLLFGIARQFELLTGGFLLGVDDMSLPQGGFFDVKTETVNGNDVFLPWDSRAHKVHRDGKAADISRFWFDANGAQGQRVDCQVDTKFKQAVRSVGAAWVCESGGRKHINFPNFGNILPQ